MPNYLERVAMSAAGATAPARPPVAAPPLLVGPVAPLEIEEEVLAPSRSNLRPVPYAPQAMPAPSKPPADPSPVNAEPVAGQTVRDSAPSPGITPTAKIPAPAPLPLPLTRKAEPQTPAVQPPRRPASSAAPGPPAPQPQAPPLQAHTQVRSGSFTFPSFAPGITVSLPKTLRPTAPAPSPPPPQPLARAAQSQQPATPIASPTPETVHPAPAGPPSSPAASQTEMPVLAPSVPRPPLPRPPAPVAAAPAQPERRPRLHIANLDLQVINTTPVRPEPRPSSPAAPPGTSLESRFLERFQFRL